MPNPTEKALFRKGRVLYEMQRFRESCESFKLVVTKYPHNMGAKREFSRVIDRLAEQEKGRYNFKQMQNEAAKMRPPILDHATYIGPVCIKSTKTRGRGLFTTEEVKAGDLLLCEKAFSYACDAKRDIVTQGKFLAQTVHKLFRNPSLIPVISNFHHGSYKSVDVTHVDGVPVVDT